ncbi:MAG: EAL domain-containing protein [Oscillospiraceae bacterium]|nr:EAL domain-containing protein [Oscillospiraceae bacterium]
MILIVCYSRKMTKGNANRLFLLMTFLSLISALADLGMVIVARQLPLTETECVLEAAFAYAYLLFHNITNAVLLLFLLSLTRMTSLFRKSWVKLGFILPNAVIFLLLLQNPFTHTVFTVTPEAGYSRSILMPLIYIMAGIYGIGGLIYCMFSGRFLARNKWVSLLCMYLLSYAAVVIQFFRSELLLEMFFDGLGIMGVMLSVMRPEERMDSMVGMESWKSFQEDLSKILRSGEHVQIVVIRLPNSREILSYLGDHQYNEYISLIGNNLQGLRWKHLRGVELYFERPGTIYLTADGNDAELESIVERLHSEVGTGLQEYADNGVRFEPQVCLIHCPDDLQKAEDIISLSHRFHLFDAHREGLIRASEIVHSRVFSIESNMEEILKRAVREHHIQMHYQPIYNVRAGRFQSAEALARIVDPEYGLISPAIFIPAAEETGLIIPIGDEVLDQVFRFISEQNLDALGLDYIEINLSVAQCMQRSLPEKFQRLKEKYGVDPGRVNLEITETTFENISEVVSENVNELIRMGFTFALDDYGIGYSSIQRVNHLPLKLIKIDKSMLDEVSSRSGRMILEHTVRMMQSIDKQLVVEGAETRDAVDILENMDCDFIQGYFFSRPLPAEEFVTFIQKQKSR